MRMQLAAPAKAAGVFYGFETCHPPHPERLRHRFCSWQVESRAVLLLRIPSRWYVHPLWEPSATGAMRPLSSHCAGPSGETSLATAKPMHRHRVCTVRVSCLSGRKSPSSSLGSSQASKCKD